MHPGLGLRVTVQELCTYYMSCTLRGPLRDSGTSQKPPAHGGGPAFPTRSVPEPRIIFLLIFANLLSRKGIHPVWCLDLHIFDYY